MRPQFPGILLFPLLLCFGCHHAGDKAGGLQSAGVSTAIAQKTMGIYSGNFNKGLITLVINYISGRTVSGYNIHKGLRRNINGQVSQDGGQLNFVLKEPGDNPFDGTFYFSLDTTSLKIKGKWVPIDSVKITTKKLALSRREADPDAFTWTSAGGGDTTLTFLDNGACEYSFYERPQDSTSQLITVRGNYDKKADTFKIEWPKNIHTPAQTMKLVEEHRKMKTEEGEEYERVLLRGQGWEFVIMEGD